MAHEDEHMHILEMIESGKISATEGLQLLQSLVEESGSGLHTDAVQPGDEPGLSASAQEQFATQSGSNEGWVESGIATNDAEPFSGQSDSHLTQPSEINGLPSDTEQWRKWWAIPLWIGVGLTVAGGVLMYSALQSSGISFWFLCAGLLFTLGLSLVVLAWQSRSARWLHLRIQQHPGQTPNRIALSFPLPIHLTAWFFRTFRDRIPGLQNTSIDEMILALDRSANPESPIFISVNEEDGESVQVFIG